MTTEAYNMQSDLNRYVTFRHGVTETAVLTSTMSMGNAITISPDIHSAHTINESVSISSVQRTYNILESMLTDVHIHH